MPLAEPQDNKQDTAVLELRQRVDKLEKDMPVETAILEKARSSAKSQDKQVVDSLSQKLDASNASLTKKITDDVTNQVSGLRSDLHQELALYQQTFTSFITRQKQALDGMAESAEAVDMFDAPETSLPKIDDDTFERLLDDHEAWVRTDGKEGRRGRFENVCLKNRKFTGKVLNKAVFRNVDLSQASFSGADLTGADLTGARFEDVAGLTPIQLSQAKLEGAFLPEDFEFSATRIQLRRAKNVTEEQLAQAHCEK